MKKIHVCTVRLAIEVEDNQCPEDGVTALLTEQCKWVVDNSCLLDWQYEKHLVETEVDDDFGFDSGVPEIDETQVHEFDEMLMDSYRKLCNRAAESDDHKRAAGKLADALKDIYNVVGELPEVKNVFKEVEYVVEIYAGLQSVENGNG